MVPIKRTGHKSLNIFHSEAAVSILTVYLVRRYNSWLVYNVGVSQVSTIT